MVSELNISTEFTTVENNAVSQDNAMELQEEEYWCSRKFASPYEDPCKGLVERVFGAAMGVVVLAALFLNCLSFAAFFRVKMNKVSLFLLKCLTIFDSLYLIGAFAVFSLDYYLWQGGLKTVAQSAYIYVEQICYAILVRMAAPMSYWIITILTIER